MCFLHDLQLPEPCQSRAMAHPSSACSSSSLALPRPLFNPLKNSTPVSEQPSPCLPGTGSLLGMLSVELEEGVASCNLRQMLAGEASHTVPLPPCFAGATMASGSSWRCQPSRALGAKSRAAEREAWLMEEADLYCVPSLFGAVPTLGRCEGPKAWCSRQPVLS